MTNFSQINSNHFLIINIFKEKQSNYEKLSGQYHNSSMKINNKYTIGQITILIFYSNKNQEYDSVRDKVYVFFLFYSPIALLLPTSKDIFE